MDRGGEGMHLFAEGVLQRPEQFGVWSIDELFGQLSESRFGGSPHLVEEFLDTGFTPFSGLCCSRSRSVQHGCDLAVMAMDESGFPTTSTAYPKGCPFAPKIPNRTRSEEPGLFALAICTFSHYHTGKLHDDFRLPYGL
jgi:hypothetical protein